jgi:hypothetical protein
MSIEALTATIAQTIRLATDLTRPGQVPHARYTVTTVRRLAAIVAVLALCAGNVAVCAGWQATPEARMACCTDDAECPMRKSEGHDHSPNTALSQAQADSCCAASTQRRDSPAAGSPFASSGAITLVPVVAVVAPTTAALPQEWRALAPLPVSTIPKHLLLSVLIV